MKHKISLERIEELQRDFIPFLVTACHNAGVRLEKIENNRNNSGLSPQLSLTKELEKQGVIKTPES